MKKIIVAAGILAAATVMAMAGCSALTPIVPAARSSAGVANDATAPTPGTDIVFSATATGTTTISWGAATDNATPVNSLKYKIVSDATKDALADVATVEKADSTAAIVVDWTDNLLTRTLTGLAPGATCNYAVLVQDLAGNKAIYAAATVAIPADTAAPSVPTATGTGIAFSNTGTSATTVSWGEATADDITAVADLKYKLVRSTATMATVAAAEAATTVMDWTVRTFATAYADTAAHPAITSYADTGLSAGTYHYAVLVKDAAGNKALYAAASVTITAVVVPTISMDGTKDSLYAAAAAAYDGSGDSWGAKLGKMSTYSDGANLYVHFTFATTGAGNNVYIMADNTSVATGKDPSTGDDVTTGWGNLSADGNAFTNGAAFNADLIAWGWRDGSAVWDFSGANKIVSNVGTDVKSTISFVQSSDKSGYEYRIPYAALQAASGDVVKFVVLFGKRGGEGGIHSAIPAQTFGGGGSSMSVLAKAVPVILN